MSRNKGTIYRVVWREKSFSINVRTRICTSVKTLEKKKTVLYRKVLIKRTVVVDHRVPSPVYIIDVFPRVPYGTKTRAFSKENVECWVMVSYFVFFFLALLKLFQIFKFSKSSSLIVKNIVYICPRKFKTLSLNYFLRLSVRCFVIGGCSTMMT